MSTEAELPRKLVAVLYADVAGYSRLTGADEESTHRRLSLCLDLFAREIRRHRGKVVHYAGDAVLAEFATASDALTCAARVQSELAASNATLPQAERVVFRIGVNLGEVIVDRKDIYGDGVNVAARLEALAEPGGICVSEAVRAALGQRLPFVYEDLGEQRVKNIERPVHAFRVRVTPGAQLPPPVTRTQRWRRVGWRTLAAGALVAALAASALLWSRPWSPREEPASLERMAFPLPDAPSVAVLPFDNMSGDPAQEYVSDGLSEDLITSLSKVPDVFVIARNSTFVYKGTAVKVQRVAEELGVRYVVEGSYQRAADRVRVHAQLIDALSGRHLWAERFDREWADLFALQDDLTASIVDALAVKLTEEERRRIASRYTRSVDAYDLFLRGQAAEFRFTPEDNRSARALYESALKLDPDFARAYGTLAMTHAYEFRFGWGAEPRAALERALALAREAVARDADLPQAQFVLGQIQAFRKRYDEASAAVQRAISLDRNYADAYALLAVTLISTGRAESALAEIETAMRLNPAAPSVYHQVLGRALYFMARYRDAVASLQRAVEMNPNYLLSHLLLAASHAQLGNADEADWEKTQILALEPDFTVRRQVDREIIVDRGYLDVLAQGLVKAGLPQ